MGLSEGSRDADDCPLDAMPVGSHSCHCSDCDERADVFNSCSYVGSGVDSHSLVTSSLVGQMLSCDQLCQRLGDGAIQIVGVDDGWC